MLIQFWLTLKVYMGGDLLFCRGKDVWQLSSVAVHDKVDDSHTLDTP